MGKGGQKGKIFEEADATEEEGEEQAVVVVPEVDGAEGGHRTSSPVSTVKTQEALPVPQPK